MGPRKGEAGFEVPEFDATCRQDEWLAEVLVRVRAVASTGLAHLQRFAVAQLQVDRR